MYVVYLLECEDGSIYTGIAKDVAKRFEEHKAGRGAKYTRAKKPIGIVYQEECATRSEALIREAEIKRMKREDKLLLIKEYAKRKKSR